MIRLLAYPRERLRHRLPVRCPHGGVFDRADPGCPQCSFEPECLWLFENDETAALESRSLAELNDALEFAACQVELALSDGTHDGARCSCATCRWLRDAQSTSGEYYARAKALRRGYS